MSYTIDELNKMIDELEPRLEAIRQERIAKGLPPELPDNFVPIPLSNVLVKQIQASFLPIAAKYASVITSGKFIKVDTDSLAKYREIGELLCMSLGFWCRHTGCGVKDMFRIMDEINRHVDDGATNVIDLSDLMVRIHFDLKCMKDSVDHDYVVDKSNVSSSVQYFAMLDKIKALEADQSAYVEELTKARSHYESIKHLI